MPAVRLDCGSGYAGRQWAQVVSHKNMYMCLTCACDGSV
eukprot:CAMPEP_0168500520 /NCGR_PEP_ID=MMETSP0228-20121227/74331_1 /TAXON_ID=133427 /ORGANISM="Protoceratium reticulatum, Strain CCCM 535 (=CCMP 1889)" /LENGTH=38 /DNA_ID= /DNA_START= /DNA_END= /DNA_ORIENTATION=